MHEPASITSHASSEKESRALPQQEASQGEDATATPPRVSIGMPVYNGEEYLEEALDSLLAQTYEDFELVISDNASTDRTEEICRAYAERDNRIRYIRNEENLGGAPNFNRVVHLARGEYFHWAAHDDVVEPEFLEACLKVLEREPNVVLAYARTVAIDEEGRPLKKSREELHMKRLHLRQPSPHERFDAFLQKYYPIGGKCDAQFGVVRRSVLLQTPMIDDYPASDEVMLGELAMRGEIHEVPEPLFKRRHHPGMYVEANETLEERLAWLNPENEGQQILPHWRLFSGYLSAIRRASLTPLEKSRCFGVLLRRYVRHNWREMKEETGYALQNRLPNRSSL